MKRLHISSKTLLQYKNDQIKQFEKLVKVARKQATEKSIHKIRVTARRLTPVLKNKKLRKMARVLGKERDLDVAINNANHYQLATRILRQAKKAAHKNTGAKLKKIDIKIPAHSSNARMLIDFKRMMRKQNLKLKQFSQAKPSQIDLHRLRIVFKKVRYGLEAIGIIQPQLQNMQDLLGHIHDLEVLQELLGEDQAVLRDKSKAKRQVNRSYRQVIQSTSKCLDQI
ncbi:MAG: CHAD domain-containing protein [Bdellovibrionales bacterium]|nr:CHAD domain-containing protein [Bdellovibrionales bacterium]